MRSEKTFPKATWSARTGKAVVLVSLARMGRHAQQRRARLFGTSETGSCSRWAYEGEVEQRAQEEVKRDADTGGDECIA